MEKQSKIMGRMKSIFHMMICTTLVLVSAGITKAQKLDDERMKRDIEVAENVLSTLIKQQFNNQRTFFPLEIRGSYQPGYGITFTLPADFTTPIEFSVPQSRGNGIIFDRSDNLAPVIAYDYRYEDEDELARSREERERANSLKDKAREKQIQKRKNEMDSTRNASNAKVIEAAKTFLVDYGDMISQLGPNEKIVITNQGNQPRAWVSQYFNAPQRTHLSVEITKSDVVAYRQGKLSREQALGKVRVVNTETSREVEPDLELLVSMFNRLYRPDLSKTFFTENNIYYERLKDFGAIFYMNVYSGIETARGQFRMPTIGETDLTLEERNRKVKELYPVFEQELKENILEYGRTVKSLKDEESLIFQVHVTRCPDCGIPSTLEYNIKGSVLKDFNSGKLDKKAALSKISIKKGANQ